MMDKEFSVAVQRCQSEIAEMLRSEARVYTGAVMTAAHLLSIAASFNYPFGVLFEMAVEESERNGLDIPWQIKDSISKELWERLLHLCAKYDSEVFSNVAALPVVSMEKGEYSETPVGVVRLASEILNIQGEENVADLCCGLAGAMLEMERNNPNANYVGYEINEESAQLGRIRIHAANSHATILHQDVFAGVSVRYNKLFSDHPLAMPVREMGSCPFLDLAEEKMPGIRKAASADWLFNYLLVDLMKENGKAIAIMSNGATWNGSEKKYRKYFVDQGLIEAIIALPAKLFTNATISTTMIVLSRGNKEIRMVDATEQCVYGRRQNVIEEEKLKAILDAYHADSEISKSVSIEEVQDSDYVLNPGRFIRKETEIQDGIPLEKVIKNVTRGAHCSAEQLDKMASTGKTNMRFLKTADIQDGIIGEDLLCLDYIEENFTKYCLKDGDVIISKIGVPYKVAVTSVPDGTRILPNANLYVITVDETKVDPYYLKAYLDSTEGQNRFKNMSVGTQVLSVSVKDLKSMLIPVPTMQEQKRIADAYKEAFNDVQRLKQELKVATERMNRVFEEYSY